MTSRPETPPAVHRCTLEDDRQLSPHGAASRDPDERVWLCASCAEEIRQLRRRAQVLNRVEQRAGLNEAAWTIPVMAWLLNCSEASMWWQLRQGHIPRPKTLRRPMAWTTHEVLEIVAERIRRALPAPPPRSHTGRIHGTSLALAAIWLEGRLSDDHA